MLDLIEFEYLNDCWTIIKGYLTLGLDPVSSLSTSRLVDMTCHFGH